MVSGIVSHYKIISKIGSGGIGDIYLAEDIKLKRTVALKFLPQSFSRDQDAKKRLVHEAQEQLLIITSIIILITNRIMKIRHIWPRNNFSRLCQLELVWE